MLRQPDGRLVVLVEDSRGLRVSKFAKESAQGEDVRNTCVCGNEFRFGRGSADTLLLDGFCEDESTEGP